MTLAKGPDPVKPFITFDNYVIPETVRQVRTPARRPVSASPVGFYFSNEAKRQSAPRKWIIGGAVFGTFLLGVLSVLQFATPPINNQMAVLERVQEREEIPVQPAETQTAETQTAEAVVEVPQEDPDEPSHVALERVVSASLQQDVTRQESADLITLTRSSTNPDLSAVSLAEILLGLTPIRSSIDPAEQNVASQQSSAYLNRDTLETLRQSVLSGDYTVKTVERNGVERLCLRISNADVTQDQAADLLRAAAARGEIELPDALSTSSGDYDADTLIFNLVQTSLANDGTAAGAEAAREMSRRAFVASNAQTDVVDGERYYVVQPGDSLAYLSLQFYGQPSAYPRIYKANRAILRSPDYIQVGQRLIIPG